MVTNTLVPGWTMSKAATQNFIELDIDRIQLKATVLRPERTVRADQGKLKYVSRDFTVVVNVAMKKIVAISSNKYVPEDLRLWRLAEFAKREEKDREELLATAEPFVPFKGNAVRKSATVVHPVEVRKMIPSEVTPTEPPRSFRETSVAAYTAYWQDFYKRMGMMD